MPETGVTYFRHYEQLIRTLQDVLLDMDQHFLCISTRNKVDRFPYTAVFQMLLQSV